MKTLKKIRLVNLEQREMSKREENLLRGGLDCPCQCQINCTCLYAGGESENDVFYGGTSREYNSWSNLAPLAESTQWSEQAK